MTTAISFTVGFVITALVFLVAFELRQAPEYRGQQRGVITLFQDILGQCLERHQPRVLVWLDNDDKGLRPHALLEAHGYIYYVRSSADASVMWDKAEEAAEYFDRKQLTERTPND